MLAKMPEAQLSAWRARIEAALAHALPATDAPPQRLHAAMRHAVLNGGKRMRPLLVYATGTALGAELMALDVAALAVELMHCYSLVHDDLPAMDDDALRRGKPTAILAGDALQTLAFEILTNAPLTAETRLAMLAELARASGAAGMCGGQALDIAATGNTISLLELERLHALKTGALLRCAVRLGALAAHADAKQRQALDNFADALGLAFQIRDDLLDIEGDAATLGKTAGKDQAQAKATFPALLGVATSRTRLADLAATMHASLCGVDSNTEALQALAHKVIHRAH